MIFLFTFIPGLMFGIEFPHDEDIYLIIDLGVFRLIVLKREEDESSSSM